MILKDDEITLVLNTYEWTSAPDSDIPTYKFAILNARSGLAMGYLNLRAGYSENITLFRGNIGFAIHEQHRGHHYAAKSCLLLVTLIQSLAMPEIYLTCNTTNSASRRSIEKLPVLFLGEVTIEKDSPYSEFYPNEARRKLRYCWEIK